MIFDAVGEVNCHPLIKEIVCESKVDPAVIIALKLTSVTDECIPYENRTRAQLQSKP